MAATEAGKPLAVALAILAGFYILYKILTPKKEVFTYYCPSCKHIVSKQAPYCWHCRIPLNWQLSPIKARLKRAPTLVFLGLLAFLVIMRFAVYPFTNVPSEVSIACDRAVWVFVGVFARDWGGYFTQTVKG